MGITVAPFSHEHFQSLPPLNATVENYHNLDGPKLVQGVFKEFFVKHGMEYTFGLALPHRHFDLKPGTRLVNYNGVSTPWPTEPGIGMQEPSPSNWSFSADGKLFPTEFRYAKGHTFNMGEREEAFVAEFKAELDRLGLGQLFGLCEYPGNDFEGSFEITRGNSNINLEPKDYPEDASGSEAAWFYSAEVLTSECKCLCHNREASHNHNGQHYQVQQ